MRNNASSITLLKYRKNERWHRLKPGVKSHQVSGVQDCPSCVLDPTMSNTYTIVHVLYQHWQYDWHIVDFMSCFVVSIHGNSKVKIYLFSHSLHSHHLFTSSVSWKTKLITENENNLKLNKNKNLVKTSFFRPRKMSLKVFNLPSPRFPIQIFGK